MKTDTKDKYIMILSAIILIISNKICNYLLIISNVKDILNIYINDITLSELIINIITLMVSVILYHIILSYVKKKQSISDIIIYKLLGILIGLSIFYLIYILLLAKEKVDDKKTYVKKSLDIIKSEV